MKKTTGSPTLSVDYQRFFNSLPNPYIAFLPNDPEFTIIAENEAHAKVALGDPAYSIGKPTFDVFPDNSEKNKTTGVSDLLESFRKVIRTGRPDTMPLLKYDVKGPDGTFVEKWWRVTHFPVFGEDGELSFFYQATEDITEEMASARKFELAQSQLDSALAVGLISTWSWDIKHDLVTGDKNLALRFGVDPKQAAKGLPLKMFTDSIHKDERERVIKSIQDSIAQDSEFEEEYRTVTKDGGSNWVIARGKLEKDNNGEPEYFLGVIVDVTERNEAQAAQEKIKVMFDALFESTILSVAMGDLHGNILQANKTFLKTFGYTQKDLRKGINSKDLTPKNSKAVTTQIYDALRATGEAQPTEKEYVRKDGTPVPMLVGAATLPSNKEQFMAFMLDITENKELRALNSAKDEFIGMASHQLRTPATAVKQYVSLLKSGFSGQLNDAQQQYADRAYDSNERQLRIVNDLLKTAQIDSNRYLLKKERIAARTLVDRAVQELENPLNLKTQHISLSDTTKGAKIHADTTEINLILVNLIENASKYSPASSTITVTLRAGTKYVSIAVKDQGLGINEHDLERVFQKFTRANEEGPDTVSGSGLGLYWVEQITKLHGGKVKVTSQPGKGSIFTVSLPYDN